MKNLSDFPSIPVAAASPWREQVCGYQPEDGAAKRHQSEGNRDEWEDGGTASAAPVSGEEYRR